MSEEISLKKVERKVFLTATQDGLLDIFMGCIFLVFAIAPFLSSSLGDFWSSVVFVPFWGIIMLGIWLVRKHVVRPRVGVVQFGSFRKNRLRKFNWVMLIVNVIAFGLGTWVCMYYFLTPHFSDVPFLKRFFNHEILLMSGPPTSVFFGLICLTMLSLAAYFLHSHRFYVYGLLVGLSPLVGEWLWRRGSAPHHGFPITFGVSAGIMIVTGLLIFIRLLSRNPIPTEDTSEEKA
jgi:hypothetical protein